MHLHFQSFPEDYLEQVARERELQAIPLIIIPGLFGSTANWRTIAKKLSEQCPVIVIDQRNHGRSPHAESNSYLDMVNDLQIFAKHHEIKRFIVCGHSMGGKVAMLFALLHAEYIEKLIVLDIAPVSYEHSHAPFLKELLKVDLSQLESRRDADRALSSVIQDDGTRLFLLQSLAGTAGSFFWRINLSVLLEYMPRIVSFPDEAVSGLQNDCETMLILGSLSDYVSESGLQKTRDYFINTEVVLIDRAGHWLHAEQPKKVLDALKKIL